MIIKIEKINIRLGLSYPLRGIYPFWIVILFFTSSHFGYSQIELKADGPGETYELITSVLAPGHDPIETPDCNHESFGRHIDEVYDDKLESNVFRFSIHVSPDNDRCINFDRQRNEIKAYDKSPDNLLGVETEEFIYKWKFKLGAAFRASSNFTHLHQLKSVGGPYNSIPIYTLTARKGSPDQLQLRYAEVDNQITLEETSLSPFRNKWVEVIETITYGSEGSYDILITDVDDGDTLFSYSNNSIVNWRSEADFVRPKWGIYRSLINQQDLEDEEVLFADFSIEEKNGVVSNDELEVKNQEIIISHHSEKRLEIKNLSSQTKSVQVYTIDGLQVLSKKLESTNSVNFDVSLLTSGTYIVSFQDKNNNRAKMIAIL